ncbi:hypothetical protein UY3_15560 [Chelonia mydas]|uniref:Uncharacterized protein n=1 Tax=Chelonia mydas TaxID=8469 RepID=M7BGK1_CHEMY|nr:hypothetical protein UY3_15560 [Chelonia mydas]
MEGDETASSHPSEDSSILDLPSAYDITDSFLPEHSTGTSEEPCSSVDTFASSACLDMSHNQPGLEALSAWIPIAWCIWYVYTMDLKAARLYHYNCAIVRSPV